MIHVSAVVQSDDADGNGPQSATDLMAEKRATMERILIKEAGGMSPSARHNRSFGDLVMVMVDPGTGENVRLKIEEALDTRPAWEPREGLVGVRSCPTCRAHPVSLLREAQETGPAKATVTCSYGHEYPEAER